MWTPELQKIHERLNTQDNRITREPMFCVQIKHRDVGYDPEYSDSICWVDRANKRIVYDDEPDFRKPQGDEWECFGYADRWETVMVAFTEDGCKEYMDLNGHNVVACAYKGETRIYVESFWRCPEMVAIRNALLAGPAKVQLK